jgi:hypothetical protein
VLILRFDPQQRVSQRCCPGHLAIITPTLSIIIRDAEVFRRDAALFNSADAVIG